MEEVFGRGCDVGDLSDKMFPVVMLEAIVVGLLLPEGAEVASADGLPAGRTSSVCGINSDVIVIGLQFLD